MTRKLAFVFGMMVFGSWGLAFPQFQPLNLRLVRDKSLPQVLSLGDCIMGKLYTYDPTRRISDPTGTFVGDTLEIPWRGNQKEISAVPPGTYDGKVREDGALGWRIELSDPAHKRDNVEIHLGNYPKQSSGCVLLGMRSGSKCELVRSAATISTLRALYGDAKSRPIVITIEP
jgi:hypothetical protein